MRSFDPADFRARPLPKDHELFLRQLLGITEVEPIPDSVLDSYWTRKVLADRITLTLTVPMLVELVASAGVQSPAPVEVPWILSAVDSKEVQGGERITVLHAGKVCEATYLRLHQDRERVRVHIEGDRSERMVPVDSVLPMGELTATS